MRFVKIIVLTILFLLIAAGIGIFIFLQRLDLNQFKGRIEQGLTESLGTPVTLGEIHAQFSISRGIGLNVRGISIQDDPRFSEGKLFSVEAVRLGLDLPAVIRTRQIAVSEVVLTSPRLSLIKNALGQLNLQQVLAKTASPEQETHSQGASDSPAPSPASQSSANTAASTPPGSVSQAPNKKSEDSRSPDGQARLDEPTARQADLIVRQLVIDSIQIQDGVIQYAELGSPPQKPAASVEVGQVDLAVKDFNFQRAFAFQGSFALFSGKKNFSFQGSARIDAEKASVRIKDFTAGTDLAQISWEKLVDALPAAAEAGLTEAPRGRVDIHIQGLTAGAEGLGQLDAKAQFTDGRLVSSYLKNPLEDILLKVSATEKDLRITEGRASLGEGVITVDGALVDYLRRPGFDVNINTQDVQLGEFLHKTKLPIQVQGKINSNMQNKGQGLTSEDLKENLTGESSVEILDGRLVNFNLLSFVVEKLSLIPVLRDFQKNLEDHLPDKYKEQMKAKDTILEQVQMDLMIQDGYLILQKAVLETSGFVFLANGRMNFDQIIDFEGSFSMSADLSEAMAASEERLKALFDENGQIVVPFLPYHGKPRKFKTYPDPDYLFKKLGKGEAKEQLRDVIDKNIEGPGKEILNDILDSIFK